MTFMPCEIGKGGGHPLLVDLVEEETQKTRLGRKRQPDCRFSFHALIPKGALDVRSDCGGYGMGFRWAQAWLGSGLEMGSESPSGHCNKLGHQPQAMLTEKQAVIQFDCHQERAHR